MSEKIVKREDDLRTAAPQPVPKARSRIEPALRRGEAGYNAKYDRACDLDRLDAIRNISGRFIHNKVIRGIIDPGAGNQREDARDQVNGDRVFAQGGDQARAKRERERRKQVGERRAYVERRAGKVADPAECADRAAEGQLRPRRGKKDGKT